MKILKYILFFFILFQSCKDRFIIGEDPYAGGKEALGLKFKNSNPVPASGNPGDQVLFKVHGLERFKNRVEFFINDERAEIVEMTDSTIKVVVPQLVSTGGASIVVDGEAVFGPRFVVNGKVDVNTSFNTTTGFKDKGLAGIGSERVGVVYDYLNLSSNSGVYVGQFTDYNSLANAGKPIFGLANLNSVGEKLETVKSGKGIWGDGYLSSILKLADGKLIVSGAFSAYEGKPLANGITRLKADGSLDTMTIKLLNDTSDPLKSIDTVPAFNGGSLGAIQKSFLVNHGGKEKIIGIGNFSAYFRYRYDFRPTAEVKRIELKRIDNIMRMEVDGTLDTTYNYDLVSRQGLGEANGLINDAAVQEDGKVIMVGSFSKFQKKDAPRIVRIDENGLVDPTFQIGTGANGEVYTIERANGKILLTGLFSKFNGVDCNGVVMLNLDGSVVPSFRFRIIDEGGATFAKLLSNGKVLVSGTFSKYDNVKRSGLLFLEQDGSAKQAYNSYGAFEGRVHHVYETTIAAKNSIVVMGALKRFNNKDISGILVLEVKN